MYCYFRWGIFVCHNPNQLTKFTKILIRCIISWEICCMIKKTIPISSTIIKKYAIKRAGRFPLQNRQKKLKQYDQIFKWKEGHFGPKMKVQSKKQAQKTRTMTIAISNPSRKVNCLSIVRISPF